MDFGRTNQLELVNFALPSSHQGIKKVLGGAKTQFPRVYVGGVLWSDDAFSGTIYPERAKPKDYAKYYSRQFNTIELNLTHYRLPEKEKIQRWFEESPADFKFCPKIHQAISHSGNLLSVVDYMEEFYKIVKPLQHKLGTCLLQLPPHFSPKRCHELLAFLDKSNLRDLAIELRHPDWFIEGKELNLLSNYLYKNQMGLVLTDTPMRRDVLHMRLTNKTAFIRFNANDKHPSDYERIDEWMHQLFEWMQQGLETIYFFVHTPTQLFMPELVTYIIQQLKKECGVTMSPPKIKTSGGAAEKLF